MKVKVGEIEIEGPDTLTADDFGKFLEVILLRMPRLVIAAQDVKAAPEQAAGAAAGTTVAVTTGTPIETT
jgi:hypothetical protein